MQEPFDTLNHEFLGELSDAQHHHLDEALPKCDLAALLGLIYEFIETYIRHMDVKNKEWG